jgi:uncharacterized protein YjbI with pentapeptide repeats
MQVVNDSTVRLAWSVCEARDSGLVLSIAVKKAFALQHGAPVVSELECPELSGDVYRCDDEVPTGLVYPSDFIPFKPQADIVLVGAAHAPGGRSVSHLDAAIRVGAFKKAICAVGDRFWKRQFLLWSKASVPTAFKSMPIVYERSYGGAKFKKNPVGLGFNKRRLPNIESPAHPIRRRGDQPPPAGFGAVSPDWEPRRSKVGTYKGKWLKERWPWFPDDFDWSHFNAAPEDQQVEGYLRGDEELEFLNLHPVHPLYRSRLPGLRARAFVQVAVPGCQPEFREVKLNLDTLWIDMNSEKLVLVWRGLTPVRSLKFKEVTHIAALTEPLASPVRPKEEMHEWMLQRVREERGEGPPTPEEAAEAAVSKASQEGFEKEMAAMDKEEAELEREFEAGEQSAAEELKQEKARLIAEGLDPRVLEPPPKPQTMSEMKAKLASEVALLAETDPEAAAKLSGIEKDLDELETIEKEFAALEVEELPPPTRESVQGDLAAGKAIKGADLSGQDFSNLDLSRADFFGANFSGANLSGTKLVGAQLSGADFSEANLSGTNFSQAILDGADFSEAKLQGVKFAGASVQGTSFSEIQLLGTDFSRCMGRHPNFSRSNLAAANFAGAKLPQADFSGANVKAANFSQAELGSADFGGASAMEINMEKADLTNLRAGEKANFSGGKFREAKAPKSIWEGSILDQADFSQAVLTDSVFEDASVNEARFDRADLTKANFEDVSALHAQLTNANLLRASFNRANLTEASLTGSNMYEASFWETVFHHTNINGANVKRTLIA